jgi:two-component system, NarL family, sensor histidine kinase EvgS
VLMLYTDMLKVERYGPLNEKQNDVLDTIHANADELLRFINNLLDEAQLEANNLTLHPRVFALRSWFDETIAAIQPLAERKKLYLDRLMDVAMPDMIYADPDRLKSILHNLVGNAIKFTRQGGVSVSIDQVNPDFWKIRVADSGPGIDEESLGRVFEPFWQAGDLTARQINSGVGLGLSIVKRGVELMNGHIEVHSVVGEGTTFIVVLPLLTEPPHHA